jgi:hypothetical protein
VETRRGRSVPVLALASEAVRGVAIALAVALGLAAPARGQLSPGPLARAHADIDQPLSCFKCHARGESMDSRCLACHAEIAWLRDRGRGLHARERETACATCHPDHAGRDFAMIRWEEGSVERFDHRRTGWPLEGKHARTACRSCHAAERRTGPAAALARRADPARSWVGLEPACVSCHSDPHAGRLGDACVSCHAAAAWGPVERFDHARTAFPLTGRHAGVSCAACHGPADSAPRSKARPSVAATRRVLSPLPHDGCGACHVDPHGGKFQRACSECHTTEGFRILRTGAVDHGATRFPLRGRHVDVACASCHTAKGSGWMDRPRFASCSDCHEDAHAGQARLVRDANAGGAGRAASSRASEDCSACHDVGGWSPSTLTAERHDATGFPLAGRHGSTACAACHPRESRESAASALGPARVVLRPAHEACTDCHVDPHSGRLPSGRPRGGDGGCLLCHTEAAFRPSTVDVATHAGFRFPLEGAHRSVACVACHAELRAAPAPSSLARGARGGRPLLFAETAARCADCHEGPHGDQFAVRPDGGACDACHGIDAFLPADRFVHDRDAAFRLEGAHARVACASCHPTGRDPTAPQRVLYRPLDSRCEACHATTTR